ncbi:hypothetical protein VOLCADRAFT_88526, partial [Volvox carteri f. nagariensis]
MEDPALELCAGEMILYYNARFLPIFNLPSHVSGASREPFLQFNGMKAKVMYACLQLTLDEEHRQIRAGFPRLSAALEVARAIGKLSALRAARSAAAGGGPGAGPGLVAAGRSMAAAAEAAAAAAPAAALQAHCRSVVEQLDAKVCEEMLAAGGAQLPRPAKRPRTASPPQSSGPTPAAPGPASTSFTVTGLPKPLETAAQLLGVLLRIRALDGSAGSMAGGAAPALGGMKIHVLDDSGNPLSLPSTLTATLMAAAQGQAPGAKAGSAPGAAGGGGQARLDGALLAASAARLCNATQVRMLLPGVLVANVLLEGPGNPAPLRVAVDCADKAFELDPWATPTTQVFRRVSSLATRVLTYYNKRASLSAAHRTFTSTSLNAAAPAPAAATAAVGLPAGAATTGVAALLPPEPTSPGAAALEDFLLWLLSCRDVFSKRCAATGRLMAWDPSVQYPVPPIFRVFNPCLVGALSTPRLPREELRLRAVDLSRVPAYHMHVAPVEQLGWAEDVPAEAVEELGSSAAIMEVTCSAPG